MGPKDDVNMTSFTISNKKMSCEKGIATNNKVTLTFHDLRYEVRRKLDDVPCCGKSTMKEILCGVSGMLPPGLNAIMGPTGSGKTSLLDVLAQRKDPQGLKDGLVLMNGEKPPQDFRLMSGYVVQDDIVMGTLTVRENLAFSANLRLSTKEFKGRDREKKVNDVIEQLGLQSCADTPVGTEFVRGVSGGERKRTNIGMEMILDPPVLFLDEPTTGLDANTANSIVLLLFKLANEGRNIIMSIHQPRYSIFSLFHRLIILNKGDVVFRGPTKQAANYFGEIGYVCPRFHNPADFFLDIVGGDVNTTALIGQLNVPDHDQTSQSSNSNQSEAAQSRPTADDITIAMDTDEREDNSAYLLDKFNNSTINVEEIKALGSILNSYEKKAGKNVTISHVTPGTTYANGFLQQQRTVFHRTLLNVIRNPMTSFVQAIVMIVFGLLIGTIYFQTDTSFQSGIQNRAGCLFFLIIIQVMSNISALTLFMKNRIHFIHESASGYYRVSVYFISQVFADIIPNRVIPNLLFCCIVYFMIGFQLEVGKFFFFLLTLVTTAVSASSLAFFVSTSVSVFSVANTALALPLVLMMLFGGFLVNTGSLLVWLEWIKYISIFRYGINALTVNEMTGLVFIDNTTQLGYNPSSPTPCINNITQRRISDCTTGEEYMDLQGIDDGVWGMWQNIVALVSITMGLMFFAYVQLRRINKFK